MPTATISPATLPQNLNPAITRSPTRPLTLAEFRRKFSNREDGFKYEFNKGVVEKYKSNMHAKHAHIIRNLNRKFNKTTAYSGGAELIPEMDQLTQPNQQRRPDLSFWPNEKITQADEKVSDFVIEIISPTDKYEDIVVKRREYFRSGVVVAWYISPADQTVSVYLSPTNVLVCEGTAICSAAPVMDDFQIQAADVFKIGF
jgi:Uma2 family endonuclease